MQFHVYVISLQFLRCVVIYCLTLDHNSLKNFENFLTVIGCEVGERFLFDEEILLIVMKSFLMPRICSKSFLKLFATFFNSDMCTESLNKSF